MVWYARCRRWVVNILRPLGRPNTGCVWSRDDLAADERSKRNCEAKVCTSVFPPASVLIPLKEADLCGCQNQTTFNMDALWVCFIRLIEQRLNIIVGSLIISSVAASESFPFVIQGLWHGKQQWIPILISTLSIAFFAEILPQYIIPKHAINWGYFCSPLIWGCMFLTGILSYPLARLLDALFGKSVEHDIFTNGEMAALIRYHDQSENRRGMISQDAARIMLGALYLDFRNIEYDSSEICTKNDKEERHMEKKVERGVERDVEKADSPVANAMIVPWSAVKTIDINEPVDKAFIRKVKSWSYSRIPVTGGPLDQLTKSTEWEGNQIFGFLHVKVRGNHQPVKFYSR